MSPALRTIGFPRESTPGDRRTILTPELAAGLRTAGFQLVAEVGLGAGVFIDDQAYRAAGVELAGVERVWGCPLVLRYKATDPADLDRLQPGQGIAGIFHAQGDPRLLQALRRSRVRAWSYEFIGEGGRRCLTGPGGQIAGVQAVLLGAHHLQSPSGGRGVLLGGAAGAAAGTVLVIGSGNAGAAAARTAAALGARVTVLTRTAASRAAYARTAPEGVRVLVNEPATLRACLAEADLVIGAIRDSTFGTPAMIGEQDLVLMRPGSVIVDVTCGYGPGYLPTAGPVQRVGEPPRRVRGVLHVKLAVLPSLVPVTAVEAYTRVAAPYLLRLARVALLGARDVAIDSALIARNGALVHPVVVEHAAHYEPSS